MTAEQAAAESPLAAAFIKFAEKLGQRANAIAENTDSNDGDIAKAEAQLRRDAEELLPKKH